MTLRQDLHIYQGQTWSYTFVKKDGSGTAVDLTGYSARAAIKGTYNGVLQSYLDTDPSKSQNGAITVNASGEATLSMTATQTAKLAGELNALTVILLRNKAPIQSAFDFVDVTKPIAGYLYDFYLVSPAGVATRELQGRALVYRQISS